MSCDFCESTEERFVFRAHREALHRILCVVVTSVDSFLAVGRVIERDLVAGEGKS